MNSDLSPTATGPSCHDVAELVQADVPALAVSTCIDHFLGPPTSGTGVLRRVGVGWNHAVLAERPASAIPCRLFPGFRHFPRPIAAPMSEGPTAAPESGS